LTHNYFYISKEGQRLEANLETHSNKNLDRFYISNSGFKDLANNFGINLEEFRFKYSTVSEVCEHLDRVSERCYDLFKVLNIFAELKAGLIMINDFLCCYSKIGLCSTEMRDAECHKQKSTNPSGFPFIGGNCLLNEHSHWALSTQRLRAQRALLYVEDKECTIEKYHLDYGTWSSYENKRKSIIKKVLRLDKQVSLIYRNNENTSEYY
jgi:hypothetical protein